eukprot:TRINITY_DN26908_c0_g1_i1.p1 TRINITY_DN26908_c0_g1~~TRINITY_DN26908_c0_g1_i1.p1  ORF type:complete len:879 (+),score=103.06 TRINITY_DN26908_c0_g1_i1:90-2726(+)
MGKKQGDDLPSTWLTIPLTVLLTSLGLPQVLGVSAEACRIIALFFSVSLVIASFINETALHALFVAGTGSKPAFQTWMRVAHFVLGTSVEFALLRICDDSLTVHDLHREIVFTFISCAYLNFAFALSSVAVRRAEGRKLRFGLFGAAVLPAAVYFALVVYASLHSGGVSALLQFANKDLIILFSTPLLHASFLGLHILEVCECGGCAQRHGKTVEGAVAPASNFCSLPRAVYIGLLIFTWWQAPGGRVADLLMRLTDMNSVFVAKQSSLPQLPSSGIVSEVLGAVFKSVAAAGPLRCFIAFLIIVGLSPMCRWFCCVVEHFHSLAVRYAQALCNKVGGENVSSASSKAQSPRYSNIVILVGLALLAILRCPSNSSVTAALGLMVESPWTPLIVLLALAFSNSMFFQPQNSKLFTRLCYVVGFLVLVDYLMFWAIPFALMGSLHKLLLVDYLYPVWSWLDQLPILRRFAQNYIYDNPRHADYFVTQAIFVLGFALNLGLVMYWQLTRGALPWWLIALYNFSWVGFGGRMIGTLYSLSHREGHNPKFYKPWIRHTLGNVFENWLGLFYGSIPYNFTTTHISIHHRLDAGIGDTLYCWDLKRCSWTDFTLYLSRSLVHMSGLSGLYQFSTSVRKYDAGNLLKLLRGVVYYWILFPAVIIRLTSASFYVWIVLQPLMCMTFFIGLVNWGFHTFIENDEKGHRIPCVESITIHGGEDDYFGEDDHMTHHNAGHVYWRDLPEHQAKQHEEWADRKASVFYGFDILTFTLCVLCKAWPLLASRFVDYSGKMSQEEIASLLEVRAQRREMEYDSWLPVLPAFKPNGYKELDLAASEPSSSPSDLHRTVLGKLAAVQLWLACQIEQGMPPVPPDPANRMSPVPAKSQ